jgi:hypothetical protein
VKQATQWLPLLLAVFVIWKLGKRRSQFTAAKARAEAEAKGGQSGASATSGLELHLHFGPQYGVDGYGAPAYGAQGERRVDYVVPFESSPAPDLPPATPRQTLGDRGRSVQAAQREPLRQPKALP